MPLACPRQADMTRIKIGMAQFHSKGLSGSLPRIRSLLEQDADLVILPEKWMNGDGVNHVSDGHAYLEEVASMAREFGAAILTGGLMENSDGRNYITCYVYGPEGLLMTKCRKLHPFGLERRSVSPGSDISTFEFRDMKVGVAICYDMDFPETVRRFALEDCDMMAVPAKIRREGIDPWLMYLQTRALENRMPVAFANSFSPPHFLGRSGAIDLQRSEDGMVMYPRVQLLDEKDGSGVLEIDPSQYREERKKRLSERNMEVDCLSGEQQ